MPHASLATRPSIAIAPEINAPDNSDISEAPDISDISIAPDISDISDKQLKPLSDMNNSVREAIIQRALSVRATEAADRLGRSEAAGGSCGECRGSSAPRLRAVVWAVRPFRPEKLPASNCPARRSEHQPSRSDGSDDSDQLSDGSNATPDDSDGSDGCAPAIVFHQHATQPLHPSVRSPHPQVVNHEQTFGQAAPHPPPVLSAVEGPAAGAGTPADGADANTDANADAKPNVASAQKRPLTREKTRWPQNADGADAKSRANYARPRRDTSTVIKPNIPVEPQNPKPRALNVVPIRPLHSSTLPRFHPSATGPPMAARRSATARSLRN
jgi:hypothetical protein